MLGGSVTFGSKSVEKRPQQGTFFEVTTPNYHKAKVVHQDLAMEASSLAPSVL